LEGILKIYCDTSVLPHNISRHNDEKSQRQLAAVNQLAATYPMFGSHLVRYEAQKTKDEIRRGHLIVDVDGLQNVPNDQKLLGFNIQISANTCLNSPIISDVQDEGIRAELIKRGLKQRDAEHITQAVCNNCDVFLTRDEDSIIRPYGDWLEQRFPGLKIRLPSELVAEL
jgi:predicted nucleic acid-binding protein